MAYDEEPTMSRSFVAPLLADASGVHQLVNERHGGVVAVTLLPAFDSATRKTGLLKHQSMPAGTAMIIAPSNAIHTFFMKFPIDVAFVSKSGRILKTVHALAPWRIAGSLRAFAAVEFAAGTLARTKTQTGDTLVVK
jgi:uncharacterized membrane protein (UPF0127 family)